MRTSHHGGGGEFNFAAVAQRRDVDNHISLWKYYRIADNILKQAAIFRGEKNVLDLYVMLLRFSSLVGETIPFHRDYKLASKTEKNLYIKKLTNALNELETLNPVVKERIDDINRNVAKQVDRADRFQSNYNNSSLEWPTTKKQAPNGNEIKKTPRIVGQNGRYQGQQDNFSITRPVEEQFQKFTLKIPRPTEETLSRHSILGPSGLRGQWQAPISNIGMEQNNVEISENNPIEIDIDETGTDHEEASTKILGSGKSKKSTRRCTSKVWIHYAPFGQDKDGNDIAKCKKCGHLAKCAGFRGTGNMQRHINKCQLTCYRDVGQMIIATTGSYLSTKPSKFDPVVFRELISMAVIRHELPYQFVEYEGVREAIRYASYATSEDEVKLKSRNTVKADINKLYAREKASLKKLVNSVPGRISLTSDLWTSIANDGYISLTAHFVDKEWKLQKKILNFSFMPSPHTGSAICEKIYSLLCEWGIEKNLFSITLDNAASNDVFVNSLRSTLILRNALVSNGEYFHIRCCCHIINLIVHDGLKDIDPTVVKVRESVKYFRGSQGRKKAFYESVKQVALSTKKGLRQDVSTRWDSTFYMLDSAIFYRLAFVNLAILDKNYTECPSDAQWTQLEKICKFLSLFATVTKLFSGTQYPTSNLFFPEVFCIQQEIENAISSPDAFMKKMGVAMKEKFDKYWSNHSKILAICVIMDPRYKIQFVEWAYRQLYGLGSQQMGDVRTALYALFDLYVKHSPVQESTTAANESGQPDIHNAVHNAIHNNSLLKDFDTFESEEYDTSVQKSQLELYLLEKRMKRTDKIDVLDFWKANQFRYPELSRMACDLLSIPVSTVASESAFSVGGRIIDPFRSALLAENVEALVCTNDWLFKKKETLEPTYEELTEDILAGMDQNPTTDQDSIVLP